ncbi:hypothetical protein CAAN1_02S02036 [[Candida] anglica]|uniref:Dienelactone hydrolase domain-containing protein n=1 Tax=[Candida] anglica TaxID=148631 RepID=A0ABP0E6P5_9ASCO
MASNPPGACCTQSTIHEGEPSGSFVDILGHSTYQVGKENGNERILVIITDIHGYKFKNTLLVADQFCKAGYHVLIPDILNEDPYEANKATLQDWIKNHTADITTPIIDSFVSKVKDEFKPKTFVGVGYCFGAKYLVQLIGKNPLFDAGAIAHPSFVTIEDIKAITKPILISAAETDPIFPVELRRQTEDALIEGKNRYQIDLFSHCSHGFAIKGDISIPEVKYAKEKALNDQVFWFAQY